MSDESFFIFQFRLALVKLLMMLDVPQVVILLQHTMHLT